MRKKSQVANCINAGSMAGDLSGRWVSVAGAGGFFFDAQWTGAAPLGTLLLQHSLSEDGSNPKTLYSWPIDGDDSQTLNYGNFMGGFVRGKFVRTSGTGTMSVNINRKE